MAFGAAEVFDIAETPGAVGEIGNGAFSNCEIAAAKLDITRVSFKPVAVIFYRPGPVILRHHFFNRGGNPSDRGGLAPCKSK